MIKIKILQLIAINLLFLSIKSNDTPKFCKKLECPEFQVIEKNPSGIEIRVYKESFWVSTDLNFGDQYDMMTNGYRTLYKYISGGNEKKEIIKQTTPVLFVKVNNKSQSPSYTMSFYLPSPFQNRIAPKPLDEKVYLNKFDWNIYAVISYSGYSNLDKQKTNYNLLSDWLNMQGFKFKEDFYYFVGYDTPLKFWNRYNEIWIEILSKKQ